MRNIFLNRSPRSMFFDLKKIIAEWAPDMIINGAFEYGGALAAEQAGLPYASASYTIPWNKWVLKHAIGRSIKKLRKDFGLEADPELEAFGRYIDLCFSPQPWRFEAALLRKGLRNLVKRKVLSGSLPLQQRIWGMRALVAQSAFARIKTNRPDELDISRNTQFVDSALSNTAFHHNLPKYVADLHYGKTIFVSLGTVFSAEYPNIIKSVIDGLGGQPINVIITLGGKADPSAFPHRFSNIEIVKFIPPHHMKSVLSITDVYVNHAGYSSIIEGLNFGIPLILLPLAADAPMNNQMCLADGVTPNLPVDVWAISPKGLPIIQPDKITPLIIREAVIRILNDNKYRNAARDMRKLMQKRSNLDTVVQSLEYVALTKSNISSLRS